MLRDSQHQEERNPCAISNAHTGRAAELLVCFDFVIRGYPAVINSFPGAVADVLVDLGKKHVLRVQVKATLQPSMKFTTVGVGLGRNARAEGTKRVSDGARYRFSMGHDPIRYATEQIDLFAFVALDTKSTLYVPGKEALRESNKRYFGAKTFSERAEGSLDRYLESLLLT